ncbi:hypothetical protein HYC85_030144 [Camellia sinensis]|uniref:Uncharacterized protein n=1 Tax=Camellia sinensis TaxID=4442 RepID=A0A7J7FZW2_CAMSI|nr:hypothetical protein HYC85_030144 [Camellia sinensis]
MKSNKQNQRPKFLRLFSETKQDDSGIRIIRRKTKCELWDERFNESLPIQMPEFNPTTFFSDRQRTCLLPWNPTNVPLYPLNIPGHHGVQRSSIPLSHEY